MDISTRAGTAIERSHRHDHELLPGTKDRPAKIQAAEGFEREKLNDEEKRDLAEQLTEEELVTFDLLTSPKSR